MKWGIITIVLCVLLVGGGVFCGITIVDMTKELNELELSYATLESSHNSLESNYAVLESKYTTLESNYNSLESSYESLRSGYDVLQGRMGQVESQYRELQTENERLRELLQQYEDVPHGYYSAGNFPYHSNTYGELCDFLQSEFVLPRNYKVGIFDCSESAAYLEWALEIAGFNANIAVGPTPWKPSGYHAWVIVHTEEHRVAIEATALTGEYKFLNLFLLRTPGIVYSHDSLIPGWENYYSGYDHTFKNIYWAVRHYRSVSEWNWWEGYWGFI